MNNHIKKRKCPQFTPPGQQQLNFEVSDDGETHSVVTHSFDQDACRKYLTRMIIKCELPFILVQREGFQEFCHQLEPSFEVPSHYTEARDCMKMYLSEYHRLKAEFKKYGRRFSLTTNTWSSISNLSYMVLTGHYIDENWVLQKKILNFCPVTDHTGLELGKTVASCLLQWGIERVFTMTVDNINSNNETIAYLSKRVVGWKAAIFGGEHMHLRCATHILALVIKDGMDLYNESISRIREAVKFIRGSGERLKKFRECCEQRKINITKFLSLDCETRWNSTYHMLSAAEKYEEAFYQFEESGYADKFLNPLRAPTRGKTTVPATPTIPKVWPIVSDWETARAFVRLLKRLYEATLKFSGSTYVTSNLFLNEVISINDILQEWVKHDNMLLADMADWMVLKYEKYWVVDKINKMLYISVLLDPRRKEAYLKFALRELLKDNPVTVDQEVHDLMKSIKLLLTNMFDEYALLYKGDDMVSRPTAEIQSDTSLSQEPQNPINRFVESEKHQETVEGKTELDMYLLEKREDFNAQFDILNWWKVNSSRYKILSRIARDVLAMQVSTVASESAFSTGGRVLNEYRSSMLPKTVQALICAEDRLKDKPINFEEMLEGIEKIDLGNSQTLLYLFVYLSLSLLVTV
ncbi:hypothetical protein MKX03_024437 [Papaver bracteatum]|nr:hypothetical protein MKX03_024437 [Papaver bracteatum]